MHHRYARRKRGIRVNIRTSGNRHALIGLVAALCAGKWIAAFHKKMVLQNRTGKSSQNVIFLPPCS